MPEFSITYPVGKPNAGRAARTFGYLVRQHDGVWTVDAPDQAGADACQAFMDAYDDLGVTLAAKLLEVKDEAQRRIYAFAPAWRQANALARGVLLLQKIVGGLTLTADEQAEAASYTAMYAAIEAVRTASNEIEAFLSTLTDVYVVQAHDVAADDNWPES